MKSDKELGDVDEPLMLLNKNQKALSPLAGISARVAAVWGWGSKHWDPCTI